MKGGNEEVKKYITIGIFLPTYEYKGLDRGQKWEYQMNLTYE